MNRRASLALVALTVTALVAALPPTVNAQSCAQTSGSASSPSTEACEGLTNFDTVTTSRDITLYSSTQCKYVAGFGSTWPEVAFSVAAMGMCGHTVLNQPPNCPGFVGTPTDLGGGNYSVMRQANFWNAGACEWAEPAFVPRSVSHYEDCTENLCCSANHETACTHVNGVFFNCYCYATPLIISLDGPRLDLTSVSEGVVFDLLPDGYPEQTSWTRASSSDAFLVLDRNGNSVIDDGREVFGSSTDQPASGDRNGFRALAVFDQNGDKQIDRDDRVYSALRLWTDRNHNGRSEANELEDIASAGIVAIGLDYRTSTRTDSNGNVFRFVAHMKQRVGRSVVSRPIFDVLLVSMNR